MWIIGEKQRVQIALYASLYLLFMEPKNFNTQSNPTTTEKNWMVVHTTLYKNTFIKCSLLHADCIKEAKKGACHRCKYGIAPEYAFNNSFYMPDFKITFSTDRFNIVMLMFRMSDGRAVTLQLEDGLLSHYLTGLQRS